MKTNEQTEGTDGKPVEVSGRIKPEVRREIENAVLHPIINSVRTIVALMEEVDPSRKQLSVFLRLSREGLLNVESQQSELGEELGVQLVFGEDDGGVVESVITRSEKWWTINLFRDVEFSLSLLEQFLLLLFAGLQPGAVTVNGRVQNADRLFSDFGASVGSEEISFLWQYLKGFNCRVDVPGIPPCSFGDLKRVAWHTGKSTDYEPNQVDYFVNAYRESVRNHADQSSKPVEADETGFLPRILALRGLESELQQKRAEALEETTSKSNQLWAEPDREVIAETLSGQRLKLFNLLWGKDRWTGYGLLKNARAEMLWRGQPDPDEIEDSTVFEALRKLQKAIPLESPYVVKIENESRRVKIER